MYLCDKQKPITTKPKTTTTDGVPMAPPDIDLPKHGIEPVMSILNMKKHMKLMNVTCRLLILL